MLASGAVASGGAIAEVLEAWLHDARLEVVLSLHILDELERTLRNPYFRRRLSPLDLDRYVQRVRAAASLVSPREMPADLEVTRDDARVIAAAIEGGADVLVTGDRELLRLISYRGLRIVSPREFLLLLG